MGAYARLERRRIVNAILYVARTGCQWRQLPHDFPNWSTVYSCYHGWAWNGTLDKIHAALGDQVRQAVGKTIQPTAASVGRQSVKTTAKGGLVPAATGLRWGQVADWAQTLCGV